MHRTKRSRALRFLVLLPLMLFVTAYQLRSSLETVHLARNLNYFVPFLVEPFSNRMYRVSDPFESDNPIVQDKWAIPSAALELLAVNHRPFRGLSVYLTQLWDHQRFSVSLRYGGSPPFEARYLFGHCTCVVSTVWELVQFFVLPPFTCILLAFFVLWRRPDSILVWTLSGLLLSLSQIELFPLSSGFRLVADTVAWPDKFRIPATAYRALVQNIWPAALLVFAAHLFSHCPSVRRLSLWIAVPFFGLALIRAVLAVAWSENYRPFVPLYTWLDDHSTGLAAAGLGLIAFLCFAGNRVSGALVAVFSLTAVTAMYWSPPPITSGSLTRLQNVFWLSAPSSVESFREPALFLPSIPASVISPCFVMAAFTMASFVVVCLCERRQMKPVLIFSLLLLLPAAVFVLGFTQARWSVWQPLWLINTFLTCTGAGLVGICRHCLRESGKRN